jgi:thiopurine S-methyltransferase
MKGPPFSVGRGEIERLFSRDYEITELGRRDVLAFEPRMRDRGVSSMFEVSYRLVRKP